MRKILYYIWQFPQHMLALICISLFNCYRMFSLDSYSTLYCITRFKFVGSFSLGNYIFLNTTSKRIPTIKHEYGHSLQSRKLGPLYLLLVGLPSILLNIMGRLKIINETTYYTLYPENWADKLGGVKR